MKLLLISQYFWPESFGINTLASALCKRGIEVTVLTGQPNYPDGLIFPGYSAWKVSREDFEGVEVIRLPLCPRGKGSSIRLVFNYLSFVGAGYALGPWLMRRRCFDAIFVYAPSPLLQALPAIWLAGLKRAPLVLWVQDLWPESLSATGYIQNYFVLAAVRKVVRFIYRHVNLLLVQSRAFEAPVRALASGTPIVYYPNSVDGIFAMPFTNDLPPIEGFDEGFSVMFAGNIGVAQAVKVIVEAAVLLREYADIHFIVLGDGSSREWMLREAKRRGLANLHLPGRFPVATMPGFMQKASVLLVTLADRAIFAATVPNKVQAYMAAGRPIIACLNGEGARLVIEAGAGVATPAEDAEALAAAILHLRGLSSSERNKMGENGRRYYLENFNHDRLVDELIERLSTVSTCGRGAK